MSAGVIGLDGGGRISAVNRQASALLDLAEGGVGEGLAEVAPEFVAIADRAETVGEAEEEVDLTRGKETHRLRVRASRSEGGLVLTFDDITRLVSAQRNAAWRDVARDYIGQLRFALTVHGVAAPKVPKVLGLTVPSARKRTTETKSDPAPPETPS